MSRTAESDAIAARYGRTPEARSRSRLIGIIAAAVGAIALVAWIAWAGILSPSTQIEWTDTGFGEVTEQSVEVRYQVSAPAGSTIVCVLEAQDSTGAINGWRVVEHEPSSLGVANYAEVVRTTSEPVIGLINRCWLA